MVDKEPVVAPFQIKCQAYWPLKTLLLLPKEWKPRADLR